MEGAEEASTRKSLIGPSQTHRQRVIALDSSDRNGQQSRVPHPIPIPGNPIVRNSSGYNWGESFTNGRNLGMGNRPRVSDLFPVARPSHEVKDLDSTTASGAAAMQRRRIYKIGNDDQSKTVRRRKSGAGFEGSRPFRGKEPLTPQTHDNRTGKGRVSTSAKRKDNPLSRYQQDETEVVQIDSTPLRHKSPSITNPATSDHKRQKLNGKGRRKIKIAPDDDSSGTETENIGTANRNRLPESTSRHNVEPIEIGSDEEAQIVQSPVRYRDVAVSEPSASRSTRPTTGLLSHATIPAESIKSRVTMYDNSSAPLQYPDSDAEDAHSAKRRRSSTSVYDHNAFKVGTRPAHQSPSQSPYFAANNARKLDTPVTHTNNKFVMPDHVISTHKEAYKFSIRGTGGQIQSKRYGWSLLISKDGFSLLDENGKIRTSAFIASENVSTWDFIEDYDIFSINISRAVPFFGPMHQIFITLPDNERNRVTKMLQEWSTDHPLFRRMRQESSKSKTRYREIYETMNDAVDSPRIVQNDSGIPSPKVSSAVSPNVSPVMSHSDKVESSRRKQEETPNQGHSTPKNISVGSEIYASAFSHNRKPMPIALPRGRDIIEKQDERHLLVAQDEVKRTRENKTIKDDVFLEPRTTRLAARTADSRILRDVRASEPLLVYPQIKGQTSVTLYEEDLDRLAPNEFLNDSIVEFYLRYNYDNLNEAQREQAHVFNTFFYQRLTSSKDREANYEAVKKWTSKGKGVDIFSKKFLVIPINENLHWYLTVVVNLDKVEFGPDITRGPETSFIDAIEDQDDDDSSLSSGSPTQGIDTSNVLGDIDDSQISSENSRGKVPDVPEQCGKGNISDEEKEKTASVISQTPPVEVSEEEPAAIEEVNVYDFCEEPPIATGKMSMTDSIRAAELVRHPGLRRSRRSNVPEAQAMEDLTLEDSVIETSPTYGRKSKRGRPRKSGPGFSKSGKHIASDVPTIIILDSLNNNHNRVYDVIKDYLVREAQDKKNEILSAKQFATCKADLPRQDNFSDCGLFLIQYTQTLLSQPDVVPQLLNRVKYSTYTASEAHKRAFKNMFEIDRIPLRRKEMIEQIKQLSVPYREQARIDEEQRKHERALAKKEAAAAATAAAVAAAADEKESATMVQKEDEKDTQEASCTVLSDDPTKNEVARTQAETKKRIQMNEHEDSIDDLNCL